MREDPRFTLRIMIANSQHENEGYTEVKSKCFIRMLY